MNDPRTTPRTPGHAVVRPTTLALALVAGCGPKARPPEVVSLGAQPESVVVAPTPVVVDEPEPPRPSIHAGDSHSCVLDIEGRLACWGSNVDGQLGDGTREDRATPMVVDGLPPVASVALGSSTTCAIDTKGTVWCWGDNANGQCASYGDEAITRPNDIARVEGAVRVTVGRTSVCAMTRAGAVWCWGTDRYRRFAGPMAGMHPMPERVDEALGIRAVDVRSGGEDVCVLDDQGAVTCWGSDLGDWHSPPLPSSATPEERHQNFLSWGGPLRVAIGVHSFMDHAWPICVWEGPDFARIWGCLDDHDQRWPIGPGIPTEPRTSWPQMAVSGRQGCLTEAGRVQCWSADDEHPIERAPSSLDDVVQVATGGFHACALRKGGAVTCWGSELHFATGDATMAIASPPPPAPPEAARRTLALRGGVTHIEAGNTGLPCAIGTGGTVRCLDEDRWVRVAGLRNVVELSNGDSHACARDSSGTVRCWGQWYFGPYNHDGSDSDFLNARRPRRIGLKATAIESWGETDCALTTDGSIHCWGRNFNEKLDPQRLTEPMPWVDIAMSDRWHCGIEASGHARCWAASADMSGDPEFELDDVAEIEVTGDRGCALRRAGTLLCWGDGPMGDATWQDRALPVAVADVTDVVAVSVGNTHSCARTKDGGVRCWGENGEGQLGDGTSRVGLVPVVVADDLGPLAGVAAVSWRPYWSSAIMRSATIVWSEDGKAWMWGEPI